MLQLTVKMDPPNRWWIFKYTQWSGWKLIHISRNCNKTIFFTNRWCIFWKLLQGSLLNQNSVHLSVTHSEKGHFILHKKREDPCCRTFFYPTNAHWFDHWRIENQAAFASSVFQGLHEKETIKLALELEDLECICRNVSASKYTT